MPSKSPHAQPPLASALYALCLGAALTLTGCKPTPAPGAATAPAPAMPLEEQLMRAALPGWGPLGVQTEVKFKLEDPAEANATYEASAAGVLQDTEDKAVLIVAGQMLGAGHPSPGVLAAYWLERKQGQWVRVAAQEPVDQVGFFGMLGKVRLVDLAPGLKGIAVESGSCWQGYCMNGLNLYAAQGQRFALAYTGASSEETSGAHDGCEEALKAKPGSTLTLRPEGTSFGDNCLRIEHQWRILPPKPAAGPASATPPTPGDLELRFTGLQATLEPLPKPPKANGASAPEKEGEDDEPLLSFSVQHQPIRETQVLRFEGGVYIEVSGKNPNRSF